MTTATSKVAIKPLEDRIVVQPLDAEQTTASGLVIPDTAKEKPQEGTVLAVVCSASSGWTTMRSSSGLMATLVLAVVTIRPPPSEISRG